MFNFYPYTDFHEMNLDAILRMIKTLTHEMDTFKVVNMITWGGLHDPNKEYPRWCIVDTPMHEGYISIKPVPVGVTITNEDYWRQVANYSALYADFQNRIVALETTVGDNSSGLVKGVNDINTTLNMNYYGILRCTSDGWVLLNDSAHSPLNMDNITISADGTYMTIETTQDNSKIGTFMAVPDEVWSSYGMQVGAGVNYHEIQLSGSFDYMYEARVTGSNGSYGLQEQKSIANVIYDTDRIKLQYGAIANIIKPNVAVISSNIQGHYNMRSNRAIEADGYLHVKAFARSDDSLVTNPTYDVDFSVHSHSHEPINWNTIAANYASWMDTAAIFIFGVNIA